MTIKRIIMYPICKVRDFVLDFRSVYYHSKLRRKKHVGKIRVGFIVQMPEIWDKEEEIFDRMRIDKRFHVQMFVCPSYDFVNKTVKHKYDDTFFFDKYHDAIKLFSNNQWVDLEEYKLDYVFYQRPYDAYLPKNYKSHNVVRFSKICYVPYAFWPLASDLCGYNREFFRNVYFAFMESAEHCKLISKKKHSGRILYKGYPALDHILPEREFDSNSILWTPRWSYDKRVGGSHFFEYKDEIIELKKEQLNLNIVIRPHPLAFENYIRLGMMNESEVEEYKKKTADVGIVFDKNKRIEDSFVDTGILITDISSIIFPFFLTEKPIIFCKPDVGVSPALKSIMSALYIANSWDDVETILRDIKNGNDYLRDERHKIADWFRNDVVDSDKKIISTIINDYNKVMK